MTGATLIHELAAVIVHDARVEVLSRVERRPHALFGLKHRGLSIFRKNCVHIESVSHGNRCAPRFDKMAIAQRRAK
ncbi:MAG: hypothetical protein M3O06_01970, partial [Pseudomonadota bacterium]|nr:hypothetical protein [Pseudomonadota bacterium]